MPPSVDVVICGAGIAGVSAAYHLAVKQGMKNVLLVDERPPLTLTSDKSTEAYRTWWPGPDGAMIRLMNRSVALLEDLARSCDNRFLLNRRGYLYATAREDRAAGFQRTAQLAAAQGAGAIRTYTGSISEPDYVPPHAEGFEERQEGADLILDQSLIRRRFPYLAANTVAVLHTRACGWFSGQQLGMVLWEQAQAAGARLLTGRVEGVVTRGGRVEGVKVSAASGPEVVPTARFVNAAGPLLRQVGQMLGVDLPVYSELHVKASFKDHLGIIPRDAPLLIWEDAQRLPWSDEEREMLAADAETCWMTEEFPAGVHTRPEGGAGSQNILILWPYHTPAVEEVFPIPLDPDYPEIVMRGMSTMIPGLKAYVKKLPRPYLDGGYYTKTQENRLLAGPLPVEGAYVLGALSGFGLMAAPAAGELLAAHIAGSALPDYAPAFMLQRYGDPEYQRKLATWGSTGQL